jgi:predicted cation transporter
MKVTKFQKIILVFLLIDVLYIIYGLIQTFAFGKWLIELSPVERLFGLVLYTDILIIAPEWFALMFLVLIASFKIKFVKENLKIFFIIAIIIFVQFRSYEEAHYWFMLYGQDKSINITTETGLFCPNCVHPNNLLLITWSNVHFEIVAITFMLEILIFVYLMEKWKKN